MAGIGRDSTHFTEEELVWFFYGEAENAAEIDLHLQLCRRCRAEFEALKTDMGTIASWTVPDRGPEYGQEVWRALVQKDASVASRAWASSGGNSAANVVVRSTVGESCA